MAGIRIDLKFETEGMEDRFEAFFKNMSEVGWRNSEFHLLRPCPELEKLLIRSFFRVLECETDEALEFVWSKVQYYGYQDRVLKAQYYHPIKLVIKEGSDFTRAAWVLNKSEQHLNPDERKGMMLQGIGEAVRKHGHYMDGKLLDFRYFVNRLWRSATREETEYLKANLNLKTQRLLLALIEPEAKRL